MKNRLSFIAAAVLGFGLSLGASASYALGIDNQFYTCDSGDCMNGFGVVADNYQSQKIEGRWRGGQTIPGEKYLVSHARTKGRKYEQVYGDDGMIVSGTTLRLLGAPGNSVPGFTGTYTRVDHTFMRTRLAVPLEGVYELGNGIEYRGRFDYLPSKGYEAGRMTQGYFIFFGDKVDKEDETTETGLYVSNSAVIGGAPIFFAKARPDYMVVLQQQFQREQMLAANDFQAQESEKSWRMAFAILGEVSLAMAGSRASSGLVGNSGGNRFAMDLVTGMLKNNAGGASGNAGTTDPSTRMIQFVTGAALGKMTGDKALADKLSAAVATGIDKANAASPAK